MALPHVGIPVPHNTFGEVPEDAQYAGERARAWQRSHNFTDQFRASASSWNRLTRAECVVSPAFDFDTKTAHLSQSYHTSLACLPQVRSKERW